MSKHTPGPWVAAPYSSVVGAPVVSQSGRSIASITYFRIGEGFKNHDEESEANARLIAAAPELLEALKQSAEGWANALELNIIAEQHRTAAEILRDNASAAIAKAEGRA